MDQIKLGLYRHYKGNQYEVTGVALHSESMEPLVVYKQLYQSDLPIGSVWVRPLQMFIENVTIDGKSVPRFKYTGTASMDAN